MHNGSKILIYLIDSGSADDIFTLGHHRRRRYCHFMWLFIRLSVYTAVCPSRMTLLLKHFKDFRYKPEISGISLKFGGVMHSNMKQKAVQDLRRLGMLREDGFSSVIHVCVDSEESKASNGIHVFVEMNDDNSSQDVFDHVVRICQEQLSTKHTLRCLTVAIFSSGTFESYRRETTLARFISRDDFQCGLLPTQPLYAWTSVHAAGPHPPESQFPKVRCASCYEEKMLKTLDLKSFDAMQEWHFDVPLPM